MRSFFFAICAPIGSPCLGSAPLTDRFAPLSCHIVVARRGIALSFNSLCRGLRFEKKPHRGFFSLLTNSAWLCSGVFVLILTKYIICDIMHTLKSSDNSYLE